MKGPVSSFGLLALCACVCAAPIQARPTEPLSLFPKSLLHQERTCADGQLVDRQVLSDFEAGWFSGHLAAAGQSSLVDDRQADTVRFLWLRSFHHPVVVRIDGVNADESVLTAIELSGAGGYDPGKIARRMSRRLSSKESSDFRDLLAKSGLFAQRPQDCSLGLDGAEWVFERQDRGHYTFLHQWTPQHGPVHDVGNFLLDLTGWKFGDRY